ncbi:uncharacterized protein LOC106736037 isoform X2 [Tupaia chinensis]|uniref:uncharacterized protein LOC106736037 isoform X2 n=1 Tax=Tupaia chinensis TaxID=246437 RepID=UPI000703D654|nr:uncharacterized protein LOC106736037 isoform X2 [Tupaia chinensis]
MAAPWFPRLLLPPLASLLPLQLHHLVGPPLPGAFRGSPVPSPSSSACVVWPLTVPASSPRRTRVVSDLQWNGGAETIPLFRDEDPEAQRSKMASQRSPTRKYTCRLEFPSLPPRLLHPPRPWLFHREVKPELDGVGRVGLGRMPALTRLLQRLPAGMLTILSDPPENMATEELTTVNPALSLSLKALQWINDSKKKKPGPATSTATWPVPHLPPVPATLSLGCDPGCPRHLPVPQTEQFAVLEDGRARPRNVSSVCSSP